MANLRERTHYIVAEEATCDPVIGGSWVDIKETKEGGAVVKLDIGCNPERLERAAARLLELGKAVEMIVNESETQFVLVDENDQQVPFAMVMKALFD